MTIVMWYIFMIIIISLLCRRFQIRRLIPMFFGTLSSIRRRFIGTLCGIPRKFI